MMIDIKYKETKDRNSWIDGNYLNATICVTEDCNLRCTYCYMVGKNTFNKMDWNTGKRIIDFLLENPYTYDWSGYKANRSICNQNERIICN